MRVGKGGLSLKGPGKGKLTGPKSLWRLGAPQS